LFPFAAFPVEKGVVLSFTPGTTVRFAPNTGLHVEGALVALGTASDAITFTAASPLQGRSQNEERKKEILN
jgi:hypothetical protein